MTTGSDIRSTTQYSFTNKLLQYNATVSTGVDDNIMFITYKTN